MLHLSSFMDIICMCVLSICIICCAATLEDRERTKIGWPTMYVVIGVTALYLWSNSFVTSLFHWDNLWKIAVYILAGLVWSLFMWFRFVKRMADRWSQYKINMSENPSSYQQDVSHFLPVVSDNKEQITGWIIFWPFSVLRYVLGNSIRDIGNWILARMTVLYNGITHSQFKRFDNENIPK